MKIAFWSAGFFEGAGGAERLVAGLLSELSARGDQCLLIANAVPGKSPGPGVLQGFDCEIFLGMFQNPLNKIKNIILFVYQCLRYLGSGLRLFWWLVQRKPDLVHQHFVGLEVLMLMLFKRLLGLRLVLTFHGLELELAEQSRLSEWKTRLALAHADVATAVSADLANRLNARYSGARVVHIPNAVMATAESKPSSPFERLGVAPGFFLFCGRLDPIKRVPELIEAFAAAVKQGCESQLLVVGDGPDRLAVQEKVAQFELNERVIMSGALEHHEAFNCIRHCCCLVLNSSSEASPMVILEAMSLGKPVIAPRLQGLEESIVHEHNGLLFDVDNPRQLAAAILQMDRDEALATHLGSNALATSTGQLSFQGVVDQYRVLYQAPSASGAG